MYKSYASEVFKNYNASAVVQYILVKLFLKILLGMN